MGWGEWEGGSEGRGCGDVCVHVADSLCCTTEANSIVKNYTPVKSIKKKKIKIHLNKENPSLDYSILQMAKALLCT